MSDLEPSASSPKHALFEAIKANKEARARAEAEAKELRAALDELDPPNPLANAVGAFPELPAPITPGAETSEGKLSVFVVKIGTALMTVGTIVATLGPALTSRVDLAVIGGAIATIGAALAGKTATHYTTQRTMLKGGAA